MGVYIVKWGEYYGERGEEEFAYSGKDEWIDAECGAIDAFYDCIDQRWDWVYILHNGELFRNYDACDVCDAR